MIEIVLMNQLDMIKVLFFCKGQRGTMISKLSTFQSFPKLGQRGGHQISNFFKNQYCHYPKGGGSKKLWTFSSFWDN